MDPVDSYDHVFLIGAAHAHKIDAQRLLERSIAAGERLVTSAEVLQEILHRYVALERRDAIQPALDALLGVVDEVFPIERVDVEQAKRVLDGIPELSARDALHVAVMRRREVGRIMSFDSGFDVVPGIERMAA